MDTSQDPDRRSRRQPTLAIALVPVVLTLAILAVQFVLFRRLHTAHPARLRHRHHRTCRAGAGSHLAGCRRRHLPRHQRLAPVGIDPDHRGHADRHLDCLRHGADADLLRSGPALARDIPRRRHDPVRNGVRVPRHFMGHGRHSWARPHGDWRRIRHPALLDRGCGGLRCLFRRQGVAAVRHHQPGTRRDRHQAVRSHPQPIAHDGPGPCWSP